LRLSLLPDVLLMRDGGWSEYDRSHSLKWLLFHLPEVWVNVDDFVVILTE
jgi:hypothetical protein